MTFAQIIEKLRDGKEYYFTHPHLEGRFHKYPWPSRDQHISEIVFENKKGEIASPTLMLYDFDEEWWTIEEVKND